jgi:hypothetical protein
MNVKRKDPVRLFVADDSGPEGYAAFFEDTLGESETPPGGYLYVKDCNAEKIVRHLEIYKRSLEIEEGDVQILWSSDGKKCGVAIWGKMRGIINLATTEEISVPLNGRHSPAITDPQWLEGFEAYLEQDQFIPARQRFWKEMAKLHSPDAQPKPENASAIETNFIVDDKGPDDLFAVFEDDASSGYLYLYDSRKKQILEHVHVYDRSEKVNVAPGDVDLAWSENSTKCGVIIWGKMRGIIDRDRGRPGRVWMENRDAPGIADQEWLKGFEYLYS